MSASLHSFRLLTAIAAAAALVACGGGKAPDGEAVAADQDAVDASTLAQVEQILFVVDDATRTATAQATRTPADGTRHRFPGLQQTNLVANTSAYGAQIVEPLLKNAWGIAIRPAGAGGHFWVGAAGSGKSIQYVGDVGGQPLFQDGLALVDTAGPVTGVAFNPGASFVITQPHANGPITAPAKFFFANASGTLSAWTERARPDGGVDQPTDSVVMVDGTPGFSSFLGVTVAPGHQVVYAADFGAQPEVRVYDGSFKQQAPLKNPYRIGSVPVPGGFEAFNVQTLGDSSFVMYGRHVAPGGSEPPPPEGRLAEFDASGKLVARWPGRGLLNYPWGVARAPDDFGLYSGCVLVGNFGDGTLVAFHPRLKVAIDYVRNTQGERIVIDGLWGLQFGNGASLGEANHMYFAAGPQRETDGLFGKLQRNPDTPAVLAGLSLCR
jgi:uncharacterized protein (TIGR03118 family)